MDGSRGGVHSIPPWNRRAAAAREHCRRWFGDYNLGSSGAIDIETVRSSFRSEQARIADNASMQA